MHCNAFYSTGHAEPIFTLIENNVFVVTVLCRRLEICSISLLPFSQYHERSELHVIWPKLPATGFQALFEQNFHQFGFVAHHIHLYFQPG